MRSSSSSAARASPISGSAAGSSPAASSTMVTRDPSRARAWPSSRPTGPAPITSRRAGRERMVSTSALVRCGVSANPGIGSATGPAPVAMITRGARSRSPSTETTPGSSKRASPRTSRTLGSDSR